MGNIILAIAILSGILNILLLAVLLYEHFKYLKIRKLLWDVTGRAMVELRRRGMGRTKAIDRVCPELGSELRKKFSQTYTN